MTKQIRYLGYESTLPLNSQQQQRECRLLLHCGHRLSCFFSESPYEQWLETREGYAQVLATQLWPSYLQRRATLFTRARQRLIQHNLRLVFKEVARKTQGLVERDDLLHEGTLGLIRAVDKFNPNKASKLSTYAVLWIQSFIHLAQVQQAQTVKRPMDIVSDALTIDREHWQGQQNQLSAERKHQVRALNGFSLSLSSDAMLSLVEQHENGQFYAQNMAPEPILLRKLLKQFDKRAQMIIKMHYGIECQRDYSLQEIATQL